MHEQRVIYTTMAEQEEEQQQQEEKKTNNRAPSRYPREKIRGYDWRKDGTGSQRMAQGGGLASYYASNLRGPDKVDGSPGDFVQRGQYNQLQDSMVQQQADPVAGLQLAMGNTAGAQALAANRMAGAGAPANAPQTPAVASQPQGLSLSTGTNYASATAPQMQSTAQPATLRSAITRYPSVNMGNSESFVGRTGDGASYFPGSGAAITPTPQGRQLQSRYGSGSVSFGGPPQGGSMINGQPSQEFFQRTANAQGVGNQFASTVEPGYQRDTKGQRVPMTAGQQKAWEPALKKLGTR